MLIDALTSVKLVIKWRFKSFGVSLRNFNMHRFQIIVLTPVNSISVACDIGHSPRQSRILFVSLIYS